MTGTSHNDNINLPSNGTTRRRQRRSRRNHHYTTSIFNRCAFSVSTAIIFIMISMTTMIGSSRRRLMSSTTTTVVEAAFSTVPSSYHWNKNSVVPSSGSMVSLSLVNTASSSRQPRRQQQGNPLYNRIGQKDSIARRFQWSEYYKSPSSASASSTGIFMSASDGNDGDDDNGDNDAMTVEKTIDSEWNLGGLRKEVSRLTVRCHKKIGKASQRLTKAKAEVDRLTSDPDASLEELDQCPNVDGLESDLHALQNRLRQLNQLEVLLQDVKGKNNVVLPESAATLAIQLQVNDEPPKRPENNKGRKKKEKGPKNMSSFRLPYRRYYTINQTEIRVGKQAEDNDELTLSPEHRDSADWWMHASGCPGSHVVIRCHDQTLQDDVIQDAAALAARQSKCTGNVIKVSLTRARDIKKPPGAKAGLVQLTGQVRTVTVDMKKAQVRLDRLDKTMLIN